MDKCDSNQLSLATASILGQPPRRKDAVIAGYWKAFQQRYSQKMVCYQWGILERGRYSTC
jgi:hypothetical protein